MPILEVRCSAHPLARIVVRDGGFAVVASGTGLVSVDVPPGVYEVSTTGTGHVDERLVKVSDSGLPPVEIVVEDPPSVAPDARQRRHTEAIERASGALAGGPPGGSGLVVAVRRPAGGGGFRPPPRLHLEGQGAGKTIEARWQDDNVADGLALWAAAVPAGSYVLRADPASSGALLVPAWPAWQTVVFLPFLDTGVAPSLAVMHCVPLAAPWMADDPLVALTNQLHWALRAPTPVTAAGLRLFDQMLERATADRGGAPPLLALMLAHVALGAGQGELAWRCRSAVARHESSRPVVPADLAAIDVIAAEDEREVAGGAPVAGNVGHLPLLARSADALLRNEARQIGSIEVRVADAFAGRLASPLWFRWSAFGSPARPPRGPAGDATSALDGRAFSAAIGTVLAGRPSLTELERRLAKARHDPAANRVLTYIVDECHIRGVAPADLLASPNVPALITATGLPAAALPRALAAVGRPPRPRWKWLRRAALGAVLVAAAGYILWRIIDVDNHGPRAVDDLASASPGASVVIDVLANDTDSDGDALTLVDVSQPGQGSAQVVAGVVEYIAAPTAVGTDTFSYTVSDGRGATATATATVDLGGGQTTVPTIPTVPTVPGNQPPVAANDAVTAEEDEVVVIDVLGNDDDTDGDQLELIEAAQPASGTVRIAGDAVEYTPATDATGPDTFSYVIGDGRGGLAQATVSVERDPVNDPPVADDDLAVVLEDSEVEVAVLANDTDVDGDSLTPRVVTAPGRGKAVPGADGTIVYTAGRNTAGTDRFTYVLTDGAADSAPAEVTVTIYPPVLIANVSIDEGEVATIPVQLRVPVDDPIEIDFVTRTADNDTATADEDFTPRSGTLTLQVNESAVLLRLVDDDGTSDVIVDSEDEPALTETFTVEVRAHYPGGLVSRATGTVTIRDVDDNGGVD